MLSRSRFDLNTILRGDHPPSGRYRSSPGERRKVPAFSRHPRRFRALPHRKPCASRGRGLACFPAKRARAWPSPSRRRGARTGTMPNDAKPSAFTTAALATGGLLLAAFSRGRPSVERSATRRATGSGGTAPAGGARSRRARLARARQDRRHARPDPGARLVGHPEAHLLAGVRRPGADGSGGHHLLLPARPVPGDRGHGLHLRPLRRACDHRRAPRRARLRRAGRRHADHRGAGEAHHQQGRGGAGLRRDHRPPHRAVEFQPGDEGDGGRAQRRLRRAREAELRLPHGADPELHRGRHRLHPARHGLRGGAADRAEVRRPRRHGGNAAEPRPLAGDAGGGLALPRLPLPLRTEPRPGASGAG